MPALLIYIGDILAAGWAMILELGPWLAKVLPWAAGGIPIALTFLRKIVAWIGADTVEGVLRGTMAMAVRIACLVAWGVFLAVVFTGIYGFSIREIVYSNPFSGFPGAMMFLFNAAFPIKFALSLVTSYVAWRFTVMQAAIVMSRTIKFLFGA
jgi:hypothetical protein